MENEEDLLFAGANKGNENDKSADDAGAGQENQGADEGNANDDAKDDKGGNDEGKGNEDEGNEDEGNGGNEGNDEGNEDLPPLIEELETKTGFSFIGEDGKKKVYEENEDGLAAYITDVAAKVEQDTIEKAKTAAFEAINPRVREFHNHIEAGNTEESFFTNPLNDIQNVVLKDEDKETAKRVIKLRANLEGYSPEMVEKKLKGYEAADILLDTAKEDLAFLQKKDVEQKAANAELVKQRVQQQEVNAKEYVATVSKIVKEGKIDGINIPVQERENVLKYLFQPVKDGKSQHDLDLEAEPLEKDLFYAYIRMKKGDLSSLVSKEANKREVKNLRDRVNANSRNSNKPNQREKVENLNFD